MANAIPEHVVWICCGKVEMGQIFAEYFLFPGQFSSTANLSIFIYHPIIDATSSRY
jgi:hypothetical protein